MSIVQVIPARERDLGGFVVRRVLPFESRKMIGPFIFFDQMGPTNFAPGQGIDVRPHPHIALATVTYLFSGALEHRDSLGSVREIRPGDVNWMTAGRGIAHSERTPAALRQSGEQSQGIQSWVALPDGHEDVNPSFVHHPAADLPQRTLDDVQLALIAGEAFGMKSPVATLWPTLYLDARFADGATLEVAPEHHERAVYVAQGQIEIGEVVLKEGQMGVLEPGARPRLFSRGASRAMLFGGERFPTPRYIWWNFVASSQERIEEAKGRWKRGEFAQVPGESEFIPLPSQ